MITEDYVSLETAKLLKEKGFDEKCFQYWHEKDNELVHSQSPHPIRNITNPCFFGPAAPTLQMAMKWLREKHHVVIDVCLEDYISEVDGSLTITYTYTIWYFNRHLSHTGKTDIRYTDATIDGVEFESYEEAADVALKYSLENLI